LFFVFAFFCEIHKKQEYEKGNTRILLFEIFSKTGKMGIFCILVLRLATKRVLYSLAFYICLPPFAPFLA
jgi:hypothetical protein